MAKSTITATYGREIFMGHICSFCKFPVISSVQISIEVQKSYAFSPTSAERLAWQVAVDAFENEKRHIEACCRTKSVLVEKKYELEKIPPEHFYRASVTGIKSPCPHCANREPWQVTSEIPEAIKITELDDKNFPVVFKEVNQAEQWAKDYVNEIINEIEEKRQNESLVEQAKVNVIESIKRIRAWEAQLKSIPELRDAEMMATKLIEYELYKKHLGILNFKRRKNVNLNIKKLKMEIERVDEILSNKETPFIECIQKEEEALLQTQAIAYGCTSKIAIKKNENSYSYHYEANDIPKDVLIDTDATATFDTNESSLVIKETTMKNNDMVFCSKCGFKLIAGSVFCTKCGTKLY